MSAYLIIDDHPLLRQGMSMTLQSLSAEVQVREAGDINEALQLSASGLNFDLIVVDLRLPMIDGLAGLPLLRQTYPKAKLVLISAFFNADDLKLARESGADGFLPKNLSASEVIYASKRILAGEKCFPDSSLQQLARPQESQHISGADDAPVLTPRQMQVLALLVQGKPNKIIGDELGMAAGTVKIHISSVLRALKVTNRTQAVLAAARWGLKL